MNVSGDPQLPISRSLLLAVLAVVLSVPLAATEEHKEPAPSVEDLRKELQDVRREYEGRIAALEAAIRRLEEERAAPAGPPAAPAPPQAAVPPAGGNESNPRISVIGDFIADYEDRLSAGEDRNLDFSVSEAEIGFQSEIDPYLRFDAFVSLGDQGAELEEGYVTTLGLPAGFQVRAGRFREKAGRANLSHPHAQPWVDQPTVNLAYFGEEQLRDDGLEVSWLAPTPFYWELSGAVTRSPTDSPTFARSERDDFLYLFHSKFLWDLAARTTLEFGLTGMRGPASPDGVADAEVRGADLTFKWVPSTYRGLTWQTEVFSRRLPQDDGASPDLEDWGAFTAPHLRLSKRWFLGFRLDYLDYDDAFTFAGADRWDASTVVEYWPSEFQTLRGQVRRTWDDLAEDPVDALLLEWVWVMGAHGAHPY